VPVIVETISGGSSDSNTSVLFPYHYPPSIISCEPTSGPQIGNQTVRINGSNFEELVRISVAGIPCKDIIYETNFVVYCITNEAEEAHRGPVIVTTLYGEASSEIEYTYNLPPYVISVTPNNGSLDGGLFLTIFGNNLAKGQDDIAEVMVAGILCLYPRLNATDNSLLNCATQPSSNPV